MAQSKYIAYYRVSTKGQGESGLGLEAQQAAVRAFLNGGNWELIASYTDIESGTSKGKGKRPGLDKALADCRLHKATLLIAKFDRLHRNVAALTALMESGVEMIACDNPNANRMLVQFMAIIAENEAHAISHRTRAALAVRKEKGLPMGAKNWRKRDDAGNFTGLLSKSSQVKGRELAIAVNRAKADEAAKLIGAKIAEIQQMQGALSYHEIAKELNLRGITTGRGKPWAYSSVRNALARAVNGRES